MILDLAIIAILVVSFVLGAALGALRGFHQLIAPALAFAAAFFSSLPLGRAIMRLAGWPALVAWLSSWLVVGLLAYTIIISVGRLVRRRLQRSKALEGWGRTIGAVVGILWGLVVVVLLAFGLVSLPPSLVAELPPVKKAIDNSIITQALAAYNPLINLRLVKSLDNYYRIMNNPFMAKSLINEESYQKLLEHKKMKKITEDDQLREALKHRRYTVLLSSDKVFDLVRDKEVRQLLMELVLEEPKE